jgi:hypothetical protein
VTPTDPAAIEALRTRYPESWQDVPMYSERQLQAAVAAERARSDAELESLREQNAALSDALGEAEATDDRVAEGGDCSDG